MCLAYITRHSTRRRHAPLPPWARMLWCLGNAYGLAAYVLHYDLTLNTDLVTPATAAVLIAAAARA